LCRNTRITEKQKRTRAQTSENFRLKTAIFVSVQRFAI
jgi:hypothetical protein